MTVATQTLTDFLLAQIAEDEAVAQEAGREGTGYHQWRYEPYGDRLGGRVHPVGVEDWRGGGYVPVSEHIALHDPARVLAQCEAYRRIVNLHSDEVDHGGGRVEHTGVCETCVEFHADMDCQQEAYPCATLRALASIYADREGFREEWRL